MTLWCLDRVGTPNLQPHNRSLKFSFVFIVEYQWPSQYRLVKAHPKRYILYMKFLCKYFQYYMNVSSDKIISYAILDIICIIDYQFCKTFVHYQNKSGLTPKFPKLYRNTFVGKSFGDPYCHDFGKFQFCKALLVKIKLGILVPSNFAWRNHGGPIQTFSFLHRKNLSNYMVAYAKVYI